MPANSRAGNAWLGVNQLWYARWIGSTPPVVVQGKDLTDLRDEIRREISQLEQRLGY